MCTGSWLLWGMLDYLYLHNSRKLTLCPRLIHLQSLSQVSAWQLKELAPLTLRKFVCPRVVCSEFARLPAFLWQSLHCESTCSDLRMLLFSSRCILGPGGRTVRYHPEIPRWDLEDRGLLITVKLPFPTAQSHSSKASVSGKLSSGYDRRYSCNGRRIQRWCFSHLRIMWHFGAIWFFKMPKFKPVPTKHSGALILYWENSMSVYSRTPSQPRDAFS